MCARAGENKRIKNKRSELRKSVVKLLEKEDAK